MNYRTEHWFNHDLGGAHIMFVVKETGSDTEPTGTVEVSYEVWTDILDALGFKPELVSLDDETST